VSVSILLSLRFWLNGEFFTRLFSVDVPSNELSALLVRKLNQCCTVFDFDESLSDIKSKEVKRECLSELCEYFGKAGAISTDLIYHELIAMVSFIVIYFL